MKKGTLYFLFVLIISFACTSSVDVPDDVLGKEEMSNILLHIYIAEAKFSTSKRGDQSPKDLMMAYEKKLYEELNIKDSVYLHSMSWYLTNPKVLNEVYEVVMDSLRLRQQKLINTDSVGIKTE